MTSIERYWDDVWARKQAEFPDFYGKMTVRPPEFSPSITPAEHRRRQEEKKATDFVDQCFAL